MVSSVKQITLSKYLRENYFDLNIKAINLPPQEEGEYSPNIIYGPSGIGKTQEYLNLLRNHKIIYLQPLKELSQNSQVVYKELNNEVSFIELNSKLRNLYEERLLIKNNYEVIQLNNFLASTFEKLLKETLKDYVFTSNKELVGLPLKNMYHVVLFIDEANSSIDDPEKVNYLRFLRKMGLHFDMRVVLSGSASISTNLVKDPTKEFYTTAERYASRHDYSTRRIPPKSWSSVEFLQKEFVGKMERFPTVLREAKDKIKYINHGAVSLLNEEILQLEEKHTNSTKPFSSKVFQVASRKASSILMLNKNLDLANKNINEYSRKNIFNNLFAWLSMSSLAITHREVSFLIWLKKRS